MVYLVSIVNDHMMTKCRSGSSKQNSVQQ